MHLGIRRKFLVGYQAAILCGAAIVYAVWPQAVLPVLVLTGGCLLGAWVVATVSNWWLHRSISRLRRAAEAILYDHGEGFVSSHAVNARDG